MRLSLKRRLLLGVVAMVCFSSVGQSAILVPMDLKQADHLKAYGLAFWVLEEGYYRKSCTCKRVGCRWLRNLSSGPGGETSHRLYGQKYSAN